MSGSSRDKHPGMMGDGTEEQSLNQSGQPDARIRKDEVEEAFGEAPAATGGGQGKGVSEHDKDLSDGAATSADQKPKDNSHNFT